MDKTQLRDSGIHHDYVLMFCIKIQVKFLFPKIQGIILRVKHIKIRHHFLKEKVERGFFTLLYVGTNDQMEDIMS